MGAAMAAWAQAHWLRMYLQYRPVVCCATAAQRCISNLYHMQMHAGSVSFAHVAPVTGIGAALKSGVVLSKPLSLQGHWGMTNSIALVHAGSVCNV
jgi:hypothetical protein